MNAYIISVVIVCFDNAHLVDLKTKLKDIVPMYLIQLQCQNVMVYYFV